MLLQIFADIYQMLLMFICILNMFSVAGPSLWNSQPVALHDRDISLEQFKGLLKTLWFV